MKPSELKEGQWIKITANPNYSFPGEDEPVVPSGAIGFHEYYGVLHVVAIDHDKDADNPAEGIEITTDPKIADEIYSQWVDKPQVLIIRG